MVKKKKEIEQSEIASKTTRKIVVGDLVRIAIDKVIVAYSYPSAFGANTDWVQAQDKNFIVFGPPKGLQIFSNENIYITSDFFDIFTRDGKKNRYVKICCMKSVLIEESSIGWCHIDNLILVAAV